jgi:hypothetical protein
MELASVSFSMTKDKSLILFTKINKVSWSLEVTSSNLAKMKDRRCVVFCMLKAYGAIAFARLCELANT